MKQFSEYDYLQQLITSISSYVEKKLKEDSNYFIYKDKRFTIFRTYLNVISIRCMNKSFLRIADICL